MTGDADTDGDDAGPVAPGERVGVDSSIADDELTRLRTIAAYQFGAGAERLFTGDEGVQRTSSGRPRQVATAEGRRLVTFGTDGRFTLGVAGGRRLQGLDAPANRVAVNAESVPFVAEERNAFAKFVVGVDPGIRPGDEVLVVHGGPTVGEGVDLDAAGAPAEPGADADERLLAVGRAEQPASGMIDFKTGMAVKVRDGTDS
ncbi:pseudouridine synthase [Halobacteriales archaeon QS_4_70_19]|nr:MAG: pseudouridine synthase [Halobacteriales archaeon QS_4_70_19]